jgi:hypothetical protein
MLLKLTKLTTWHSFRPDNEDMLIINSDDISSIEITKHQNDGGSDNILILKNGTEFKIKEYPEEIYKLLEGGVIKNENRIL